MIVPASKNAYAQYYEFRIYDEGPLRFRPADTISLMTTHSIYSRDMIKSLIDQKKGFWELNFCYGQLYGSGCAGCLFKHRSRVYRRRGDYNSREERARRNSSARNFLLKLTSGQCTSVAAFELEWSSRQTSGMRASRRDAPAKPLLGEQATRVYGGTLESRPCRGRAGG
jgi:hypothetical protein